MGCPRVRRVRVRPLLDIALENAREGCAGESLAASVAFAQARAASDPCIREHYARIAVDETRHAALSFRIHAWILPQLTPPQRGRAEAELGRRIPTRLEHALS